jgi:pimeloyl-ACP methyl ester carboxylesterase
MWGECDSVVEGLFEPRLALLERIRPGSTVTLVPGAGHWLPYEAPEAVNAHLRNVLSNASA